MGDIADMILDGTLCVDCGGYIGNAVDHPRRCKTCKKDFYRQKAKKRKTPPVSALQNE